MSEIGKDYLKRALFSSQVPNTMLFFGPDLQHLQANALAFCASLLQCLPERLEKNEHPDFHRVVPEGKSALHSIESIRDAIDDSHIAPFESSAKIFLLESAERMQPASANALLKTLEEPALDSYWILVSSRPQEIISTILSRCTQLFFPPEVKAPESDCEEVVLLKSLLSERHSYPKLSLGLEKIEKLLEGENSQARTLDLFTEISLYFREEEKKGILSKNQLPFGWEELLQESLLAHQRNIKLSACLEVFFLRLNLCKK